MDERKPGSSRDAPLDLEPETFRRLGHRLIDRAADLLAQLPRRPVTPGNQAPVVRGRLGDGPLPEEGTPPDRVLDEATELLFENSLFNGHPRFWGYITASPAPLGALGDLLAAVVNPNLAGFALSPMASEIERQTIRWIAELIGYDPGCGGLLVSGGNMGNFFGFLAARRAKCDWDVRSAGLALGRRLRVYGSTEMHTWIQKAADVFGLGTDSIRWIPTDDTQRMDVVALERTIRADRADGDLPFLVVGTAGTVGTGAIDPLPEIARVCREHDAWFHVDGAYGALAAVLPDAPAELSALARADSIALDPHKWLYSPLEAGCVLVAGRQQLLDTFAYRPEYYTFGDSVTEDAGINYYELGLQNSRGFRALKVWLGLRQAGRRGYARMIGDDIALARELFDLVRREGELEAGTRSLSIATFRYVPSDLERGQPRAEAYLDELNGELVERLQTGGEVFVSNAVVSGKLLLRACIVNFRSRRDDVAALPAIATRVGREIDAERRPPDLRPKGR